MALWNETAPFEQRSTRPRMYDMVLRCETNSTSAPDGADPDSTVGAWTRSGVGTLVFTFASGQEPDVLEAAQCYFEETDADLTAHVVSYVASTRVLTIQTNQLDATPAAADTDDKTLVVWLKCRDT